MIYAAIFGAGHIGSLHAQVMTESNRVKLIAIAERNETIGRKAAEEFGIKWYADAQELLCKENVDMVDICLPTFLHEEYALLAAKYKKHILCEKPVALSVASFDRMAEAAAGAGVKLMAAQPLRFWPEYVDIKRRYDTGEFGAIRMVYANRLTQHPVWSSWQRDPALSGGGLYDLHIHDVDYARYLFGAVKSVYALGDKNQYGCWNHVVSSIVFQNGVKAVIEASYEMTDGFPFSMYFRLTGTQQTVEFSLSAGRNIKEGRAHRQEIIFTEGESPLRIDNGDGMDPYRAEIEYFADCISGDKEPEKVPLSQSREVLCLLAAIQESLETGRVIEL